MGLPTIGMFWDGPPLGFVERLCLTSFVHVGHPVVLFSYGKVENAPDGVELTSATDVLAKPKEMARHGRTGSPAIYADKFRYHLLAQNDGMIWSDTDAYCLKPFEPDEGYFFGRESDKIIANGVMALPSKSATLNDLINFCEDEYAIPTWMMPKHVKEMEERQANNDPMHVSEMPWGAWGPKALSHFLKKNDEFKYSLAPHVLYPVPFEDRRIYFREAWKTWKRVQDDTVSIHFYGRRVRERLKNRFKGIPPEDSVLAELAQKHGLPIAPQ
ncbi:hypothetical protein CLV80_10930 [Yoonia maritima]|uniref:Alpha 1,4-glycosyltransferase n=1 Tax=Yoonia maritima TaxID=1435347 RepID=A0A2T0VWE2_9RHOB|nr:hypothetical protein [Yoonia maritima]PRY76232.1 hypothetical protein CLV80_10930 [Yoonia maritima]